MSVEQKTRKIYNLIHNEQIKDSKSVNRMKLTLKDSLLKNKLDKYIKYKVCGDFGSGNSGNGGETLLDLKAKKVYFFDLDRSIYKPLSKKFKKKKSKIEIKFGNIEKTNFKNEFFDFILCQGIIHHVRNDMKALKETYRLLKKGGYLYFDVQGEGGLITEFFNLVVKKNYEKNKFQRKILNDIIFKKKNIFKVIKKDLNKREILAVESIAKYFDDDFFLTLRDRILSPIYKQYNEKQHHKKSLFQLLKKAF